MALALVVRLLAIAVDGSYDPRHDAFDYHRHAVSIAAGGGFPESAYVPGGGPSALRAPGYPYALGAIYAVTGDSVTAGRLFGAALGALAVLLLFLVARRVWGRRVGLMSAGLAAVYPPLLGLSTELYSELLFIPLLLAAVLAVLRARETALLRWAAVAGVLGGAAALTRGPGVVALAPLALGLWFMRPRLAARSLGPPVLAIACALLVISPWTLRNAVEFGRLVPVTTSTGFGMAGTYNDVSESGDGAPAAWRSPVSVPNLRPLFARAEIDEATLDSSLADSATEFARAHPGYVAEVIVHNLLRLAYLEGDAVVSYGAEVVQPGIGNRGGALDKVGLALAVLTALVGIAAIAVSRRRRADGTIRAMIAPGPLYLWLVPVALVLVAAPVAGLPRYRIPADPFLLILSAIGVLWIVDRLLRSRLRPGVIAAAAAVLIAGCGGSPDSDGSPTSTPAAPTPAASGPAKEAYVRRADRICARALADARQIIVDFAESAPPAGGTLERTTEHLIRPGIEVRERQAEALRAMPRPSEPSEDLDVFLGLFDPIAEIARLRLAAGRAGDAQEAKRYEDMFVRLGEEQRQAAQAYGFDDCAKDVIGTALR